MFRYPLDSSDILRKKRILRNQLKEKENLITKRIALLSGSTIGEIGSVLELFLLDAGIQPEFYEGGFNRYYEELVFTNDRLTEFAPDVIYIHTGIHNIVEMPTPGSSDSRELLESEFNRIKTVLEGAGNYNCIVIVNNFEYPSVRVMGNRDAYDISGRVRFITELNLRLADFVSGSENIYLNDINYLAGWYGLERWADPVYYNAYKYAVSPEAVPLLCLSISSIIKALFGKNKKALMLDLDNTLWDGVIGDEGLEGILLGSETPKGMAFSDIQRYAKELRGIGILLGVLSKNDDRIAREGFSHPSSILSEDDFSVFMANWDDKQLNAQKAASMLNIGTDSFVFVDDNPIERELMQQAGLDIEVASFEVPERVPEILSMSGYFEAVSISEDDLKRADMYKQNILRETEQNQFLDYDEYLKSLEMKAYICDFPPARRERITQLINKTNQFNPTTKRYSAEEIAHIGEDDGYIKIAARLTDRFGDNGLVCVLIASIKDKKATIELFVMSCRVFGRNLEYAVFEELVRQASARGIETIEGIYIRTKKNQVVEDIYLKLGFTKLMEESSEAESRFILKTKEYVIENNKTIEVIYE